MEILRNGIRNDIWRHCHGGIAQALRLLVGIILEGL